MTQIRLRRDTSANFTSKNPVLGTGEPAYETDTKKLKIGDGATAYNSLDYFSSGGGTEFTVVQPLAMVDGTLTLQIDEQTIQVQDGKLVANLDELGNEVNDLSGRVTAVEADILTKANKSDLDTKEDVLKAVQPLVKTRTETSPVVGFANNTNGKAWDTATGSLVLRDMSGSGCCLYDANGNDAVVADSQLTLKKYILIPYTQGQIVRVPAIVGSSLATYAVSLVNIDSDGNIDYISNYQAMNRRQPNLNAKGTEYVQTGQYIRAFDRISGASSTGDYSSVTLTSQVSDSVLIQLRVTDTKSIWASSISRSSGMGDSCCYTSTDGNVIDRLKDVNAILLTRIGSTSSSSGMGVSETAPYNLSLIQVFEDDGTTLETLKDQVGFINSHTNIYDATKNIVDNSLSLTIGSGLSVVNGALTASGGGSDDAVTGVGISTLKSISKNDYTSLEFKDENTLYIINGEEFSYTTPDITFETLPTITANTWYASPGDGLISVTFRSTTANQFAQLAVSPQNVGALDIVRQYDTAFFSQGANNAPTLTLPISANHYYACNWNMGNGITRAVFTPFKYS